MVKQCSQANNISDTVNKSETWMKTGQGVQDVASTYYCQHYYIFIIHLQTLQYIGISGKILQKVISICIQR